PHISSMFAEAQQARDDAGAAADRVGMTRLVLTDFRNYREVRLTVGTAPVVLTGPNGAGKTNLLEAVSFLAPGRGLRGAKLAEIDRWARPGQDDAAGGWAVAAVVATRRGSLRIGTGHDPRAGPRGRAAARPCLCRGRGSVSARPAGSRRHSRELARSGTGAGCRSGVRLGARRQSAERCAGRRRPDRAASLRPACQLGRRRN